LFWAKGGREGRARRNATLQKKRHPKDERVTGRGGGSRGGGTMPFKKVERDNAPNPQSGKRKKGWQVKK